MSSASTIDPVAETYTPRGGVLDMFEYTPEFRQMIVELHRGKEHWPDYNDYLEEHLGGPRSRLVGFVNRLLPEVIHHCGSLANKRVLDFGCGTGATTVALAMHCPKVTGFDIDAESLRINHRRLREHGLAQGVRLVGAPSLDEALGKDEVFDLILMNGVLEHIPTSIPGLRRDIMRSLCRRLAPGGFLFLSETPNRVSPHDTHSTGLWWIPWTPAGSRLTYRYAMARGRHADSPTATPGPQGFEEVGAWGATYWEIKRYLRGTGVRCVNLESGHDRRVHYSQPGSSARRTFEKVMHPIGVKVLRAPLTAFTPFLCNLVFRKD